MPKIILIEPGDFTKEMIDKLEEKGVTVIECKNPEKVKILSDKDFSFICGDDLFMAALTGANHDGYSQKTFAAELFKRAKIVEAKKSQLSEPKVEEGTESVALAKNIA
jgi:hypothetical protein